MPITKNMAELEKMLKAKVETAMCDVQKQVDIQVAMDVWEYYSMGKPKVYKRTGALGHTPRITPLKIKDGEISFMSYLDKSHTYSNGVGMGTVLEYTEYGTHGVLGKPFYWVKSQKDIEKILNRTMKQYFKK